ncbi:PREDICTED: synaptotagmin-like protein 2 isoform X2 [Calidris pugnax]|uniref:synaptotagmin-like protein 2 isoform X2 n=1 Tax=Calidris pugnax TaxID=198806 RepID=UPI00071CE907|nr:PREDICTED: synaptotagmin-like protein 2 isoform X2 [Calidris pugnax]
MKASVSPAKPRRNPFNSTAPGDNLNSSESENRQATLPQLSQKEIPSHSEESHPKPNLQNDETERHKKPSVEPTDESQKGLAKRPVPKARKLIHKATDPVSEREDFVPKPAKRTERVNGTGTPPRGILKRSSSSSSTDSEVRVSQMLDVQKKNALPTATIFEGEAEKSSPMEDAEESTQISLEKLKQVRFSSSTGKGEPLQSPQPHHGREGGEFDSLKSDKIKSSEKDAIRSDSSGNKQISAVKALGTDSSSLQVKTTDGFQDTSASSPCDTNRSDLLVNEALQAKRGTPKELETPQKTSSTILPNSNNELRVDETRENKATQFLSRESKSDKNVTDDHQLSSKTEAHEVPNTNSTSLQQGKPDLVEQRDAKTSLKPDKYADELMEVANESVSKVLDWFKRSSGTEDRKSVSARSQGREPNEELDFSTRTVDVPAEHCGPKTDGKPEGKEELPVGKMKQRKSSSSTSLISKDKQLIKERMKPEEENEEQNDESRTEFDCPRGEEKEHGQEIEKQNEKSDPLEHQEQKVPAQKYESEKAMREKRRIREIRAFWEGHKTVPSHGEKEVSTDTNASGGSALKGLRESDKIKPAAIYLPQGLDDQSKNTLRSAELTSSGQAFRNEHQNSSEFGPGRAVEKPEGTLPPDGEVDEYTQLPKTHNLQPSVGATSASPGSKDKDEKETLKGNVAACSQQKPSFQVLSSKEKMNEKSKNQISSPSQFQNLRNFWDTGVKSQSNIDRADASLPHNTGSITYDRKSKEDKKGRDNVSKQELVQQQTQTSEREKNQNLDSVVCDLPLGSPTLKGLDVVHTKNTDSVQLDRKAVTSKLQEKMGLPEQEVKACVEKGMVSSKERNDSLQLLHSPDDKDALKETTADDCLRLPIEKVENKTPLLDVNLPKEEVAETVDKVVLPKAELDVFKLGLKKLEKEASEMSSSLNLKENILKETTLDSNQCKVSERRVEESHDVSLADQTEEISESTGKVNGPSADEHENKKSLRRLFREFEPFCLRYQAADKDDALGGSQWPQAGLQNLLRETCASQPSEYRKVGMETSGDTNSVSQTNCSTESTHQEDTGQPEEVNETIEKFVAPSKVSGLSSALEKLLEEASEMPPPKLKRADSTVQGTAEMEVESTTDEDDGELPQEIREAIEKSVAPSKVNSLSSALEKLLEEASETPPPKPKRVISTVQRTAEVEVESTTYEDDGELPQEIRETIGKSIAPTKVNSLSSALEKLLEEASETPPPKPKRVISTVQRTAEVELESTTDEDDEELPQEIREAIEKSFAPSKVSSLSSTLKKLMKGTSEMPPPKPKHADSTVWRTAEMEVESTTGEDDGDLLQEIRETVEKSVAPSKVNSLSSTLEKLLEEASGTPPPEPKRADSTVRRTAEMEVESTIYGHDGDLRQEIGETVEKSVAPSKVNSLSSALEKLLEEASGTPPPKPKRAVSMIQRTVEVEVKHTTYEHDGELPQECRETTVRSAFSKAEYGVFDVNLQMLPKEVSETPASVVDNTDKKMQGKIHPSPSMHGPHQQERGHPQEVEETIERTSVSNIVKFSEFSSSSEKLFQEASEILCPISKESHKHTEVRVAGRGGAPEQNIKTSVNDLVGTEIEAPDLPKRDGAISEIQDRNMAPVDLPPLEGETSTIAVEPCKINEKERRGESTSLDAPQNNSEFTAVLKFRRESTPLKGGSDSPQPEGAQLCQMSQREDNAEEEGGGSNLGSKFSDENSDSHSGSSTRSEEELNPVLMALKRSADRKMPSKSLEDIPSATSNTGKKNNPKEELALSAEDVSTVPSQPEKPFANPEKLKGLSKSVPSFLQDESDDRETDTASESSYSLGRIKKSPSSLTNLSGSSGMASLSSVSSSLMSIYSADFGNVDVKGTIQFAVDYVEQLNELHIFICQCKDLAVADVKRQRSDPYVKTYLLPEKYKLGKRKTSVKKKTFNPVYNEILRYKIEKSLLQNQSLNISVWHNDTFGRNSFLGEVELDLGTWDWNDKSNKQIKWLPLKPRTSTTALELESRGEMKLALQYVPHPVGGKKTQSTGEVHIWVKECHDLPLLRGNRLNSFIKCTILPDTSRKSRQKTRTVAKTTNPVFNHTMVYDGFRPEDLKEACVELTVWDHNKLANHFLGGLRIGLGTGKSYGTTVEWMDSTSDETALWEKMINSPNTWIEDTLPLRMLMVAKLTK